MMRIRHWFILLLACNSTLAGPTTHPVSPLQEKIQSEISLVAEQARLPALPATQPSEIIKCSVVHDMLMVDLIDPKPGNFRVVTGRPRVIATINETPLRGMADLKVGAINYVIRDFSPPGAMTIQTTVITVAGRADIVQEREDEKMYCKIELMQDPPGDAAEDAGGEEQDPVRLTLQVISDPPQSTDYNRKLSAKTFTELRQKYPDEVRQFLRPVFRDLGQESVLSVEPAVAWQVLGADATPDPAIVKQVNELLPRLGADAFQTRRAAMKSLRELGQPAVLVLTRTSRAGWNVEQSSAVDSYLASIQKMSPEQVARLRSDPQFLLDVQYCDDVTLRTLAAKRLHQLVGQPVEFDPKAPDDSRLAAVEVFRRKLPATRPIQ